MEKREVKGVYVAFVNILSLLTYNKICRQVQNQKEKKNKNGNSQKHCTVYFQVHTSQCKD